jgi:murein DD-endopeptidase MepM/ murein hydrolase activator NlpD
MIRVHPLLGRLPGDDGLPPMRTSTANPSIGDFGWTRTNEQGKPQAHKGVDELCVQDWPCHAAHDGMVTRSGVSTTYGEVVYLAGPDGLETRYAHLKSRSCAIGDVLKAGDQLGRTGKTGNADRPGIPPHLHWEVRINDTPIHPLLWLRGLVDPLPEVP